MLEGFLTVGRAAARLGMTRQRVDQLIARGDIPCQWAPSGRWRIVKIVDLDQFRAQRGISPAEGPGVNDKEIVE